MQVRLPVVATDHDAAQLTVPLALDVKQLNVAARHSVMNRISVEDATSLVAVNGNRVISAEGQSLSSSSNIIKPPVCVVQSVYTLPVQ